jgi:carboxymethylenebutenolidase
MSRSELTITTRDGACPASIFTPDTGTGPWPGVIFYMDALAIRPTLFAMAQRLADAGYVVLLPDLFYRDGPSTPIEPAAVFADPALREAMMRKVKRLDRDAKVSDSAAFLATLETHPDVAGTHFGATGYCMGGNWALTAIGAYPDRLGAIASFHGGNLASDDAESPHRFLGGVTGRVYVAGAIEDASFPDEQKERLEAALTVAGIDHVVETYEGAHHGWTMADFPVYNAPAAERHWTALIALLHEAFPA